MKPNEMDVNDQVRITGNAWNGSLGWTVIPPLIAIAIVSVIIMEHVVIPAFAALL